MQMSEPDHRNSETELPSFRKDSLDDNEVMELNSTDFIIQDYEFDPIGIELATDEDDENIFENAFSGRMTPDGVIDEDFETELGICASQELTVQETIDAEYADISRLGVIQVGGDDRLGRKVIVFSACRLPPSGQINYQRLLEYIQKTLQQYVAMDYSLIYFHYGLSSRNKPPFRWLIQAYRSFDRNFKKNLKALYLVHPTHFVLIIIKLFRPIISAKFGQKISFIKFLRELKPSMYVEQLPIPQRVRLYDEQLAQDHLSHRSELSLNQSLDKGASYSRSGSRVDGTQASSSPPSPHQQFGVTLQHIQKCNNGNPIAPVLEDAVTYIRVNCLNVEGIFRRSVPAPVVRSVQETYNKGGKVDFKALGNPHLAAVIIKTFLRDLQEPILTFGLYDSIVHVHSQPPQRKMEITREMINSFLPEENYTVLKYVFAFLVEVSAHSSENRMTDVNLGIVFGPNMLWSEITNISSFATISQINSFAQLLISDYDCIFIQ